MFMGTDRHSYRKFFFEVWKKYSEEKPLEPLEQQLLNIMLAHPEYHDFFEQPDIYLEKDFFAELGEVNPFLHMALHQTIVEQLVVDHPKGIYKVYEKLLERLGSAHEVEHLIMDELMQVLFKSQQDGKPFDEYEYIERLEKLVNE